jgi:radical SAM protein with 4Fe4S-binding SPASM domain
MLANMIETNKVYFALAPDFMQKRDGKTLLIWSFLPYWMVVSDQLLMLLTKFNGKNTLKDIIDQTVTLNNTPPAQYEGRVKKIVNRLLEAKILSEKPERLNLSTTYDITSPILEEITISFSDTDHEDTVLTVDELKTAIRTIHKYLKNNALLHITGEKPVSDFTKLASIANTAAFKGLVVLVDFPCAAYSNELIKEMKKMRVQVQVNFDGAIPSINDAIQGEGRFEKNIECIQQLLENKIYTILNLNTSEHNYQELDSFLNLAKNLGVQECRIMPIKKFGTYKDFRTPDYREIISYLMKAIEDEPAFIKLLGRDIFTIFEQLIRNNEHVCGCGAGIRQIYIGADGCIYPCHGYHLPQFAAGNLKENPLDEIWEASPILREIRDKDNVRYYPQCAKCVIRYWCRGGCRAETLINTGLPNKPALSCKSLQMSFIDLFWKLADKEETIRPRQPYC